jgi:catechol 2,3-dioxygenase-like lactoylglutathione lyase family enzyme
MVSTRGFWNRTQVARPRAAAAVSEGAELRAVNIPCAKFPESRRFYVELLGLQMAGRGRSHIALAAGASRIILLDTSRVSGFSRGNSQGLYLELVVPDLAAVRERLHADGARLYQPRREAHQGRLITVEDPEGNLINVVERGSGGGVG